jgi:uncharacterized protein
VSTWRLRDWLEEQRADLERARGVALPRPELKTGEADTELAGWLAAVEAVAGPLRAGIPVDEREQPLTAEGRASRLLADLLGWHRREQKPDWWRYFHQLTDMTDEERLEAREPLAMLELIGAADETGRRFRYRFPEQDHELGREGTDPATGKSIPVESIDEEANEIVLRFPSGRETIHPRSLVSRSVISSEAQEQRLLDIGRAVLDRGMEGDVPYRAAQDLLARRPPHIIGLPHGAPLVPIVPAVPVVVSYNHYQLGSDLKRGAPSPRAYRQWIDRFAKGIAGRRSPFSPSGSARSRRSAIC